MCCLLLIKSKKVPMYGKKGGNFAPYGKVFDVLVTNPSPVWGPTRLDELSPVKKQNVSFVGVCKLQTNRVGREPRN